MTPNAVGFEGDAHSNAWSRAWHVHSSTSGRLRCLHQHYQLSTMCKCWGYLAPIALGCGEAWYRPQHIAPPSPSTTFDAALASPNPCLPHAGFVELYRDGEVIQAVVTCSFFFGSVVYGVTNENNWDQVERLQFLVWAILSGTTCWLVSVLGQRVHAVSELVFDTSGSTGRIILARGRC